MRHKLSIEGPAFRLRPIDDADTALVLELRGNPELNRFLHRSSSSEAEQRAWFARYYDRPGDYYFVVEARATGQPEGLVSIYDVDGESRAAEWGRWILRPGSLAAIESAWLTYRCAFELLGLDRIYCRTVADNLPVVSFHDSCGIEQRRSLPGHFELDSRRVDAIEHQVDRRTWTALSGRLEKLALRIARSIERD